MQRWAGFGGRGGGAGEVEVDGPGWEEAQALMLVSVDAVEPESYYF